MIPVGFVGLGNMGGALATNLSRAGFEVLGHDVRGASCSPDGVAHLRSVDDLARRADVVVLSLPDGPASESVAREIVANRARATTHLVDTSTIGVEAALSVAALLEEHRVAYIDAPVSGGVAGARARTLAVMYAANDSACAHVEPVLAGLSDRRYRVGNRPGLGQAMKLANNFLSATALAATSEAVAFGRSVGLDTATMLDVLNGSSGQNTATSDKFPNHVLNERYASGFTNTLMAKDVRLYLEAVTGTASSIASAVAAVWDRFAAAESGADFTRIYPFTETRR